MFDISALNNGLTEKSKFYNKIYYFEIIDSTNTFALNSDYPPHHVIIAGKQLKGKGRSGRKWVSKSEDNLYLSIILPDIPLEKLLPLNIVTAYSIVDALRDIIPLKIKWPNDIIANGKKLGGILFEAKFSGYILEKLVLGIGLNINQKEFDGEISGIATSIYNETGIIYPLETISLSIIQEFEKYLDNFLKNSIDIIENWCKYSANYNKSISIHINGVKKTFVEIGINENGELIALDDMGNSIKILSGDINL